LRPSCAPWGRRVELREGLAANEPPPEEVLALDEALDDLEKEDPLKAQIVILRSFAGMSVAETARVLGPSQRTLQRHWRFAKVWLKSRLAPSADPE
jgi:DNA-directed RNA polymerase specialized sigma24 family protein